MHLKQYLFVYSLLQAIFMLKHLHFLHYKLIINIEINQKGTKMKKDTLKLFTSFFKIGLFTFGGGYAMIPLIKEEVVKKHQWITENELLNIN